MKEFKIRAILTGSVWVENPRESWEWRGSHVEDTRSKYSGSVIFNVWADTRDRAVELVGEYHGFDFSGEWHLDEIEEVKVVSIEDVPGTDGLADEEYIEVEYE